MDIKNVLFAALTFVSLTRYVGVRHEPQQILVTILYGTKTVGVHKKNIHPNLRD